MIRCTFKQFYVMKRQRLCFSRPNPQNTARNLFVEQENIKGKPLLRWLEEYLYLLTDPSNLNDVEMLNQRCLGYHCLCVLAKLAM